MHAMRRFSCCCSKPAASFGGFDLDRERKDLFSDLWVMLEGIMQLDHAPADQFASAIPTTSPLLSQKSNVSTLTWWAIRTMSSESCRALRPLMQHCRPNQFALFSALLSLRTYYHVVQQKYRKTGPNIILLLLPFLCQSIYLFLSL